MKSVILLFALILNLTGCLGLTGFFTPKAWVSQDVYMHLRYKRMNNWYLNDVNHVCKYCKKISEDAIYSEYYNNTISPRSKYKGICTTIYKVRKSDNIIVSWRFEGKKYDCLR
jgi:hypothetical protein